jgi:uncharacterized C2H2 Zn-finger protein
MEVLQRGVDPKDREYTSTCRSCGTVFKYKRREAREVDDWRDGNYLVIKCPTCARDTTHYL